MKKVPILIIIFAIWFIFSSSESVHTAKDPVSAAGFLKFKDKRRAPGFTVEDLEGKRINLEDFRGKTVMLDFWTSW
ncbi:MAG: hypothetical protein ACE5HX_15185 [bacterium]